MMGGERGELEERERAAVGRLVQRACRLYGAASTLDDRPAGPARADLVLSLDPPARGGDWRGYVRAQAGRAAKVFVVVVPNPERAFSRGAREGRETLDLAGVLWELGRVREHAYLVLPGPVEILAAVRGWLVAPDVAQAPVGPLVRRTARLHAFVVDTAPRTPQARRKLRAITDASGGAA
jgi:hypothetical protein